MRTQSWIPLLLAGPFVFAGLTACDSTTSLNQLRTTTPATTPFNTALATYYRDYAEAEVTAYDWAASQRFADKGLAAAKGIATAPEEPSDWNLSKASNEDLYRARGALMEALTDQAKADQADIAARAQFNYDCWVENTEDGWQAEDISDCRERFFTSLTALQAEDATPVMPDTTDTMPLVLAPTPEDASPDTAAAITPPADAPTEAGAPDANAPMATGAPFGPASAPQERTEAPAADESGTLVLYFPFDAAVVESGMLTTIDGLIARLKEVPALRIVINGHADRAGTDIYNMGLSRHRAEYLRTQLIEHGIDPARVEYYAFGESDPAVPTPDGVKERANRRVEIFLE